MKEKEVSSDGQAKAVTVYRCSNCGDTGYDCKRGLFCSPRDGSLVHHNVNSFFKYAADAELAKKWNMEITWH